MARRDLSKDYSTQAAGELDYQLRKNGPSDQYVPTVSVDQALGGTRLRTQASDRNVTRVLFISQNTSLLNPSRQTLDGYINVADMFDEVHILVLRTGIAPRQPVLRPDTNVWIYTVATPYWWQLPKAGLTMLADQLLFATGFRADVIVARDPLESGLVALKAAKAYNRTAQVHITHSSYSESGKSISMIEKIIAWYTIPKFTSVRVANRKIWNQVQSKITTDDLAILPKLNPYELLVDSTKPADLKKQYPQYIFNMLFVGSLETGSTVLEVIDAAAAMLKNTSVSLIIIGDGPLKSDCKRKTKALGIEQQIIYLPSTVDVVSYLKSAHVLFVTDTDAFSEDIILQAAYAKIPMLLSTTEVREDLFSHLESVFFCAPHAIDTLSKGLAVLMNDVSLREHLASQALAVVKNRLEQDPQLYQRQYRESIEAALFSTD